MSKTPNHFKHSSQTSASNEGGRRYIGFHTPLSAKGEERVPQRSVGRVSNSAAWQCHWAKAPVFIHSHPLALANGNEWKGAYLWQTATLTTIPNFIAVPFMGRNSKQIRGFSQTIVTKTHPIYHCNILNDKSNLSAQIVTLHFAQRLLTRIILTSEC
ncbi:MAG: hypothetical protein V4592_26635 [Bacteroidota bacterium]